MKITTFARNLEHKFPWDELIFQSTPVRGSKLLTLSSKQLQVDKTEVNVIFK